MCESSLEKNFTVDTIAHTLVLSHLHSAKGLQVGRIYARTGREGCSMPLGVIDLLFIMCSKFAFAFAFACQSIRSINWSSP